MSNVRHTAATTPGATVVRTPLLAASLTGRVSVERVVVNRVVMAPGQASGLHLHPCPVIGIVERGAVFFQIEGELAHVVNAGEAFYEPAYARVSHFDAQGEGATFVAHPDPGHETRYDDWRGNYATVLGASQPSRVPTPFQPSALPESIQSFE